MNAGRWREIDQLFEAALEKTGAERQAMLEELEPAIRPEVEQLLEADRAARTFLERSTWLPTQSMSADRPRGGHEPTARGGDTEAGGEPDLPSRIGPYKVLGVLGEGGMGRVLLAARADEQYQRLVAIKTLRARFNARGEQREELLARFDLERQALAQLEHPNIARLYDAGRDERGDPYLVLEHIDGVPLDVYCDENRLDVEARLRLFLEVCQGVQAAHRNLLVHRDLKPSNILVTREGRPMLLDFGIAKLLDPARGVGEQLAGELFETREGSRPMTPGYASPEQVKGEPITTASDVYSLGVLLYELLTGRKPYRVTSWLPHELEKAICEVEPEKPSTAVFREARNDESRGGLDASLGPAELAQRRGSSAGALARRLRGDLDTLLHKALRKDPDQRYASVEALAQDIAAFLEGRPLAARPPSTLYTLRKFAVRHRFAVAAGGVLAALLIAFLAVLTLQARQIRAERDKAQQALAFLIEVFKASDPSRAQGEELKAREILDGAARRIEKELAAQPEIQATLMDAMGQVYLGLGLYREADSLFGKALARRRRELGADDPATLAVQRSHAWALLELGEVQAAKELFEGAVAAQEGAGASPRELADARLGLGDSLHWLGQGDAAIAEKEAALALLEAEPGLDAELAAAELSLGISLSLLGQPERAGLLFQRSEGRRRRLFGDQSLEVAQLVFRRGELARMSGRFDEAIALLKEAILVQRRLFGPDHPDLLASLQNLAICYAYVGDATQSVPLYEEILAKRLARVGRSLEVATTESLLGNAYTLKDEHGRALVLFEDALAIRREAFSQPHGLVADSLCNRADALRELGRLDEAAADCRAAIEIQRKLEGGELAAERGYMCLGQVELARRDFAGAEAVLRPVYEARSQRLAPGSDTLFNSQVAYGCALAGLARHAEAEPILREVYGRLVARNKHSSRAGLALECLAPVARALGRADVEKIELFRDHSHQRGPLEP